MARITFGPTISAMKGSIGGTTFQTNAAGAFARSRPYVKKSSTIKQQQLHTSHQKLLYQYSILTSDQKDDWNTFAAAHIKVNKFGQEKTLTGSNWFLSTNYMRILTGETILASPPAYNLPSDSPAVEIVTTSTTISLNIDSEFDWTDMAVIIWCALPTNRQKISITQIRKYLTVFVTDPGNPIDITANWEAATGITWAPITTFPQANIFICTETICISSGITAPMLCTKINTASTPIYDPDAQAYFDAVPTPFSTPRKNIINDLVVQLKADGNWDVMDRMWLLANEASDQGLVSLINPGSTAATLQSSPSFTVDRGFTSNGITSYINSHYNPSTDGSNYTQNDACIGVYSRTNVSETSYDMGSYATGTTVRTLLGSRRIGGSIEAGLQTTGTGGAGIADSLGLVTSVRTSSSSQTFYHNGSSLGSASLTSAALTNLNMFILCISIDGTASQFSSRQIAFAFAGSKAIDQTALYSAIQTYMTAIGANV